MGENHLTRTLRISLAIFVLCSLASTVIIVRRPQNSVLPKPQVAALVTPPDDPGNCTKGSCPNAAACIADINQDGIVDLSDFSLISVYFSKTQFPNTRIDITGDGLIDLSDFAILHANFGKPCSL